MRVCLVRVCLVRVCLVRVCLVRVCLVRVCLVQCLGASVRASLQSMAGLQCVRASHGAGMRASLRVA